MNRTLLAGSCALAVGLGTLLAPAAAARGQTGPEMYPCSDHFVVPLDPQAWTTDKMVVISPYGTDRISCGSWHGFFSVVQADPQGKVHVLQNLLAAIAFIGSGSGSGAEYGGGYEAGKVYVWQP
ncbi:hypothetical protein [Rhodococcus sp. UNC363MFTsu5.1]|uniref:hypothetical protein n=1 Tax=Rhodococcus sp. UNC363MFTsu5.1 TaxID=1449069 RepID=UPI0012DCCF03|nr:hypothetical protein [Rhodococcus sp. UNC363MFTsu5.1]